MNIYFNEKQIFFNNGNTLSYDFRIKQLNKLKNNIKKYELDISNALFLDLGKPEFEIYTSEIGIVYQEINHAIKNLKFWMKKERVKTPLFLFPAKSYIYKQPKGIVFIISPWNYPFQLAISPLIGAIAAGCCTLVKPSNKSIHTSNIINKIISETFNSNYISTIQGPGSTVVKPIIEKYKFDHIFFTGSTPVGKSIMRSASNHLTPVTLELGGKSPAIVLKDTNIDMAAKRIVWGKFYNAGQTCVAIDYLIVEDSIKNKLINRILFYIKKFYGNDGFNNISKIIDAKSFNRLIKYIEETNVEKNSLILKGNIDKENLKISPTLIQINNLNCNIMKEEIFGPILPIISFKKNEELFNIINQNPSPLALYIFTNNKFKEEFLINNIQFGGGAINHSIIHLINPNLPFGGVGNSGMGEYHSKYSFDTFTHKKSIIKNKKFDFNLIYPPYNKKKLSLVKKILK